MKKEQQQKLAEYLKELSCKLLQDDREDWIDWVAGSLKGLAEGLEIQSEDKKDEEIKC